MTVKDSKKQPTPDYDSRGVLKDAPEMWLSEINYIEDTLVNLAKERECLEVLEWGSGNGTVYFSKFLQKENVNFKWVAVEHFIPWFEKVVAMLKTHRLSDRVECFLKSPTYEEDKNIQETLDLNEYIHFPATLGIEFDFILVDGRRRKECLHKAVEILSPDGVVVLHDAERPWYHEGCKHYVKGGEFVTANSTAAAWGGIQKLWIGRLR